MPTTCNTDGCPQEVAGRGLCQRCYQRQWDRAARQGLRVRDLTDAEFAALTTTRRVGLHPLQGRYWEMISRCERPTHPRYPSYGGRGISVCPEWRGPGGFERYVSDLGPKPTDDHRWTIDRVDNNGPYCGGACGGTCGYGPTGNVRWATYSAQNHNKRPRQRIAVACAVCGAEFTATQAARYCSRPCRDRAAYLRRTV